MILDDSDNEVIPFESSPSEDDILTVNKEEHFKEIHANTFNNSKQLLEMSKKNLKQFTKYYFKEISSSRLLHWVLNIKQSPTKQYLLLMSHNNQELTKMHNPLLTFKHVHIKDQNDWIILNQIFTFFTKYAIDKSVNKPIFLNINALNKYLNLIDYDFTKIKYDSHTDYNLDFIYLPFKQTKTAKVGYTLISSIINDYYLLTLITIINNNFIKKLTTHNKFIKIYKELSVDDLIKSNVDNKTCVFNLKDLLTEDIFEQYFPDVRLNPKKSIKLIFTNRKDINDINFIKHSLKQYPDSTNFGIVLLIYKQMNILTIKVLYKFTNDKIDTYTYRPFIKTYQEVEYVKNR